MLMRNIATATNVRSLLRFITTSQSFEACERNLQTVKCDSIKSLHLSLRKVQRLRRQSPHSQMCDYCCKTERSNNLDGCEPSPTEFQTRSRTGTRVRCAKRTRMESLDQPRAAEEVVYA